MNWSANVAMNCPVRLFVVVSGQTAQAGTVAAACDRRDIGAWVRTDKWWRTAATAGGGGGGGQAAGARAAGGRKESGRRRTAAGGGERCVRNVTAGW